MSHNVCVFWVWRGTTKLIMTKWTQFEIYVYLEHL